MVLRVLLVLLLLVFGSAPPLLSQENGGTKKAPGEAAAGQFPGLSELGQRSAALDDFVSKAEERLQQLADLTRPSAAVSELREQFEQIRQQMRPFGPPETWYVDRLNSFIGRMNQLRDDLEALQQRFAQRQQEVENIRLQARQKSEFWSGWPGRLEERGLKVPGQTFSQAGRQIEALQEQVSETGDRLLLLQEKIATLQRHLLHESDLLADALSTLRKATFRRNAYSLFDGGFYRQFDGTLGAQAGDGLRAATRLDRPYLRENAWQGGLLAAVFAVSAGLMFYCRRQFRDTEDWDFILQRPWTAAGFLSIAFCWFWFPAPPPLLRFVLGAAVVVFATVLALSLLESRRQRQLLVIAAVTFLLNNFLQLVSLPQPLYRLFIVLLALILVPLLYWLIVMSRTSQRLRYAGLYRALLRLGMFVLTLSLFAQVAGYMNFSSWLVQALFETGIVFLLTRMGFLLLSGAIDLGKELLVQLGIKFFEDFGDELGLRLKRLLWFVLFLAAIFYLLPVWRLFSSHQEGWAFLNELGFQVGNLNVSLQMIGLALFALYLALQVSWVMQAVTESQLLKKRNADRGVQDAVKKLIHYGIVLVGFLFAMSLLGLELQNFMVLLGAFGVGIGFGLQDIVNNFLSGLILLFERPIKVGDGVVIDGEYGVVLRIGMRSTVVRNLDEAELIVPNSHMISQKVTNWTLSNRRVRVVVPVGVAYGSNLEKVLAVLSEAGSQHPEVLEEPKPSPLFAQFGASSLDFELRVWISNVDHRPRIKNELLLFIDKRFREEKIEIPFSQHDLHIRSLSPGVLPPGLDERSG